MIDSAPHFQLRFRSLFDQGRGFAFPCSQAGVVDLDHLSEHARNNYFYGPAMVGRELLLPAVERRSDASLQPKEAMPGFFFAHSTWPRNELALLQHAL